MLLIELGEAAMRLEELVQIANEGRDVVLVKDNKPVAKLVHCSGIASAKGKGLLNLLRHGFPTPTQQPKPVE